MAGPSSPGQEGPDDIPPRLPEGWLAQWDGQSRKYYYVQRATGHSQWEVPTKPALSAPTPEPTPQGVDPFGKPIDTQPAPDAEYAGQDRSLLGDLAIRTLGGGGKQSNHSSGLGSLAQGLLGHGKSSNNQTPTNVGGPLLSSILGAGKTHGQSGSSNFQSSGAQGGQTGQGVGSFVGNLLHGHHGQSQQGTNYGYNPGQATSGAYSGQAPPPTYSPVGSPGSFGPSNGPYHPLGTQQYNASSQAHSTPSLIGQSVSTGQSTNTYQPQTTPQPYGNSHPGQGHSFQNNPLGSQYQASNPPASTYGQHASPFPPQTAGPAGYAQYDQQHNQQTQSPYNYSRPTEQQGTNQSFPQPLGPGQGSSFPTHSNLSAQSFPSTSSGPSQSFFSQQQQSSSQHGGLQNFPPPPPPPLSQPSINNHFGQQNVPMAGGYPTPSGSHPSLASQQIQPHLSNQGYNSSPAPPMHSHPSNHGYSNNPNHQHTPGYAAQGQQPQSFTGQGADSYANNYEAPPPAPSWR